MIEPENIKRWSNFTPSELRIIDEALRIETNVTEGEQAEHEDLREWVRLAEQMVVEISLVRFS